MPTHWLARALGIGMWQLSPRYVHWTNLNKGTVFGLWGGDTSFLRGKTVVIEWSFKNDSSLPTRFFIDDMRYYWNN